MKDAQGNEVVLSLPQNILDELYKIRNCQLFKMIFTVYSEIFIPEYELVKRAKMPSAKLAFPSYSFDIILSRHSPFEINEILRCLKAKGIFITQQVGLNNTKNICDVFGCGTLGEIPVAATLSFNDIAI